MRNSKQIGNQFERKVAKLLSKFGKFCRTPSSGVLKMPRVEGDVMNIDNPNWDWIIECKTMRTGSIIPVCFKFKDILEQTEKRYGDKKWILFINIRANRFICCISKYVIGNYYAVLFINSQTYFVYNIDNINIGDSEL